jgi:hypothetical protein
MKMSAKEFQNKIKSGEIVTGKKGRLKQGDLLPEYEAMISQKKVRQGTHVLISPIRVQVDKSSTKKVKIALNLNTYRNLHYILNNKAKVEYKRLMAPQISKLPKMNKVSFEFILHKNSKRRIDRHNVCSIVQKFFCDALVEMGKLKDDNDSFVVSEKYVTGDNVKGDGCCEIIIKTE